MSQQLSALIRDGFCDWPRVLLVQTLTVLILPYVRHRVLSVSASSKQTSDDEDGSSRDA